MMLLQATSTCTQCWSSNKRRLPRGILWVVTTPMSSPRLGGARPPWNAAPKGVQPEGVKLTPPGPVSAFAMENPTWRNSAGRACYTVLPSPSQSHYMLHGTRASCEAALRHLPCPTNPFALPVLSSFCPPLLGQLVMSERAVCCSAPLCNQALPADLAV